MSAPLLKRVSRMLEAEGRNLEAVLEEVLGEWLKRRQIPDDAESPESRRGDHRPVSCCLSG